jgi:hypothetical protein
VQLVGEDLKGKMFIVKSPNPLFQRGKRDSEKLNI